MSGYLYYLYYILLILSWIAAVKAFHFSAFTDSKYKVPISITFMFYQCLSKNKIYPTEKTRIKYIRILELSLLLTLSFTSRSH